MTDVPHQQRATLHSVDAGEVIGGGRQKHYYRLIPIRKLLRGSAQPR